MAASAYLETDRLIIVLFQEEHLTDRYVAWLNDPQVVRYSEQRHRRHSINSSKAYFHAMEASDNLFLAICDKASGLHVGNATVYVDGPNQLADVSIMVGDRTFWGKGLGAEAFKAVVDHVLQRTDIRKVTAGTMAENRPMLKAMALAGMKEESRWANHYLLEGHPVDVVHFSRWSGDGKV